MDGFKMSGWFKGFKDSIHKRITLPLLKRIIEFLYLIANKIIAGYVYTDWKEKTLNDFKCWLIDLPDDIPASQSATLDSCDLYTILGEFSSLRQEIRIQNREQAKAIKTLSSFIESYKDTYELFKDRTKEIANLEDRIKLSTEKESEKRMAIPFLDMRDALVRGLKASKNIIESKSILRPIPKGFEGTIEGYEMAIRRFDRALSSVGILPIKTVGNQFDPKTMRAIEKRSVPEINEGEVIEELLSGFLFGEEVLRTAEVVVNE